MDVLILFLKKRNWGLVIYNFKLLLSYQIGRISRFLRNRNNVQNNKDLKSS
ncbi:hypothetical protein FEM21_10960 [Flavobacterium seoulense]|uniref:Uncharacterized protein n=1 Tax=Flavobacterium seoulense TaxID=1492738 RepID=A0A066WZ30_9FLAO|nr:hypothetical protein FEM21_10960 [Flavobacterium seoulense]